MIVKNTVIESQLQDPFLYLRKTKKLSPTSFKPSCDLNQKITGFFVWGLKKTRTQTPFLMFFVVEWRKRRFFGCFFLSLCSKNSTKTPLVPKHLLVFLLLNKCTGIFGHSQTFPLSFPWKTTTDSRNAWMNFC